MASGIISLGQSGNLLGQIAWESVSNGSAANSSNLTVYIQARKSANTTSESWGTFSASLSVGGENRSFSPNTTISPYSWKTLGTVTKIIDHDDSGNGSCLISGSITGPSGTSLAGRTVSGSGTAILDQILRYAKLEASADFTDLENPTIQYSNPLGNAIASLTACISVDGENPAVPYRSIPKTGNSYQFVLAQQEQETLWAAVTAGDRTTVTFIVRSSIDGTQDYKSKQERTYRLTDPAPTASISVIDANPATAGLTNDPSVLVLGMSNAQVAVTAVPKRGAVISSISIKNGSKTLTGSGTFHMVESDLFTYTVTDSRGNYRSGSVTMDSVPYFKPTCGIDSTAANAVGDVSVIAGGQCFLGDFGALGNSVSAAVRYKAVNGSYSAWIPMTVSTGIGSYTASKTVTVPDYTKAYVFQIQVTDLLGSTLSVERSVAVTPVFDWSQSDFAFHVPVGMNGNRITGLGEPTGQNDAASKGYIASKQIGISAVLESILRAVAPGHIPVTTSDTHLEGCADAPIQGLTVYGQSTQSGAQMPIVSVGDDGSLSVAATDGTQSNTVTVTEGLPLRRIGAYRDELVVSASGGYLKRRVGVFNQQAVTASNITTSGSGSSARRALGSDLFSVSDSALQGTVGNAHTGILCANLPVVPQAQERNFNYPVIAAYGHGGTLEFRLRFPMSYTDAQILSIAKNTYVLYPLAEPQIIPLSSTQVQAILALRTYKPETDITAEGAELEVTYAADTKLYIDQKFAQLQAIITE